MDCRSVLCKTLSLQVCNCIPPWNDGKGLKMQADSSSKASETNDQSSRWDIPEVIFINTVKSSTT